MANCANCNIKITSGIRIEPDKPVSPVVCCPACWAEWHLKEGGGENSSSLKV